MLLLMFPAARAAGQETSKLGEFIPAAPPQPAPEVSFTDADGKPATLADFNGKPAVVNLWATWCRPCLKEMPSLDRLQRQLAGKLKVAAISEDHGSAERVRAFVAKMGLKQLTIYFDPKADVAHAFRVVGLPTSIVLDAGGRVVGRVEGAADWDSANMLAVLQPLLHKGTGAFGRALKHAAR
jgi:thiol-disulfide isomerase/thioredoxin